MSKLLQELAALPPLVQMTLIICTSICLLGLILLIAILLFLTARVRDFPIRLQRTIDALQSFRYSSSTVRKPFKRSPRGQGGQRA